MSHTLRAIEQIMNVSQISLMSQKFTALSSGGLWWPDQDLLCVSDLHLGKSERQSRLNGISLPPYDTQDTLHRLSEDLNRTGARTVICLGDSFDDIAAAQALEESVINWISQLQAGRDWIWIEGNHDPGPVALGGTHRRDMTLSGIRFQHIADAVASGEITGHYHPKVRIKTRVGSVTRPAFLFDQNRILLPSYGTYTGGLFSHDPSVSALFTPDAEALLIGKTLHRTRMPRCRIPR